MAITRSPTSACITTHLGQMSELEGIKLEPSAVAGVIGAVVVSKDESYQQCMQFTVEKMQQATHLVWATGGGMVPKQEMASYLLKSREVSETLKPS